MYGNGIGLGAFKKLVGEAIADGLQGFRGRYEEVVREGDVRKEPFCKGWTAVIRVLASELNASIRSAGWHFMWMTDSGSSSGLGATPEVAIHRALVNALKRVSNRFNVAELGSLQVTNCLGLKIARVMLQTRQIQRRSSLALAAESRIPRGFGSFSAIVSLSTRQAPRLEPILTQSG